METFQVSKVSILIFRYLSAMNKPLLVCLSLCLFTLTQSLAQAGYMRLFGDSSHIQQASSLFPTADKGLILCGVCEQAPGGHSDVLLVKVDSLGRQQWAKTYGGPYDEFGVAVKPCPSGGYYFLADAYGWSADSTKDDYLVGKVDLQGNLEWNALLGGADNESPTFLDLLPDGSLLIGGDTWSVSGGAILAYAARLSPTGSVIWQKGFGMANHFNQKFYCSLPLSSGDVLLAGSASPGLMSDYYMVRLNTLGDTLMNRSYGFPNKPEFVKDMVPGPNGQTYFLGLQHTDAQSSNVTLLRLNANADTVSHVSVGSFYFEQGICMDQLTDGSLLVAGYVDTDTSAAIASRAVIYHIPSGNAPVAKWAGPAGYSGINDIRGLPGGGYMACGEASPDNPPADVDVLYTRTNPQGQIGCTEENYPVSLTNIPVGGMQKGGTVMDLNFPLTQATLIQADYIGHSRVLCGPPDPQGVDENNKNEKTRVYPNPCSDKLYVTGDAGTSVQVFDILGKPMRGCTFIPGNPSVLYTQELPNGMYLLQTSGEKIPFIK